ncbi:Hypothetical predicted protein [Octopus vulgaris]|uniref:Secreted protein n=1 Tax=Octopus vulgaris TaxID=6645 RepID=A0AA36BEG0_OCTVU|nr:Hypothetical predicted protein [Octopus vulgaris]
MQNTSVTLFALIASLSPFYHRCCGYVANSLVAAGGVGNGVLYLHQCDIYLRLCDIRTLLDDISSAVRYICKYIFSA